MLRNIAVRIVGDSRNLQGALNNAQNDIRRFGQQGDQSLSRVQTAMRLVGTVGVAAFGVAAGAMVAATTAAIGFEQRMRNVNSIVQGTDEEFAALSASTLALSRELPTTANDLAEGLYDVASSGFLGADGLLVTEAAARAASAGMTSTATAAQTIAAVLNSYGRSAEDATDVSDVLFSTVNLGVISFEQLSGVLSAVGSTAAGAGISINDTGAAIATMTLAGVQARQAGTALNNLITRLVNPTDQLKVAYEGLGFASGQAALDTLGLNGVVEALGEATGGSLGAIVQLTGDMESARAVLALSAQDGRLYAGVQEQIGDANNVRGATETALQEQMRSTALQLQVMRNRATATAIELGTKLLPAFQSLLETLGNLGSQAVPVVQAGFARVVPIVQTLYRAGLNVVETLRDMFDVVRPAATAIAGLVGAGVLAGLQAFASLIEGVTAVAERYSGVLLAVAAIVAGAYLASVVRSTVAIVANVVALGAQRVAYEVTSARALIAALGARTFAAGLTSATAASVRATIAANALSISLTAGLAVALAAVTISLYRYQQAKEDAADQVADITAGIGSPNDLEGRAAAIDRLWDAMGRGYQLDTVREQLRTTADDMGGVARAATDAGLGLSDFFGRLAGGDDQAALDAYDTQREALDGLLQQQKNVEQNLRAMQEDTGLTRVQLLQLANTEGIDLTQPYEEGSETVENMLQAVTDLEVQTGLSAQAMNGAVGNQVEAWEALQSAIEAATSDVRQGFASSTNVLGSFKPGQATQELADASDALADAEERLSDVRANEDSSARDRARAEEELADARERVNEANSNVEGGELAAAYRNAITLSQDFTANVQRATEMGLDPTIVLDLMKQGPEQAGPILEQIVADSSGAMVELVNTSQAELARYSEAAVSQARLTQIAISSSNDDLVRDLDQAMAIQGQVLAQGANATADAIAAAIGVPSAEVQRIAQAYGITLARNIQAGLNAVKIIGPSIATPVGVGANGQPIYQQGNRRLEASGGHIRGPGTWTSDSIPAMLSDNEYVQPALAVAYYGVGFMEAIRQRRLPKMHGYASGGLVGASGRAQVVQVPVTTTITHERPIVVEQLVASDVADFRRRADREHRLAQLGRVTG